MHALIDLPPDLAPLADFLADSLLKVQDVFDHQLRSDLPPVSKLCRHVERYRGKMLRPTLVLLSGLAAAPPSTDPTLVLTRQHHVIAAVCEMVHMATLVHDDVLDEADTRRRGQTVNRLYGNEAAVILGDHLIASAYHLCSTLPTNRASLAVGKAAMVTCAGELLQLHHRNDFSLDEPTYFEIVTRKTAELIATAAELGAAQSGAPDHACASIAAFGRKLGIAFQIQDDLIDLTGREDVVGKPVCKDIEKGKMTLPLIHHLANADPRTRGRTLLALEAAGEQGPLDANAAELLAAMEHTGSLAYARTTAMRYVTEAKQELQHLADSPAKRMLLTMADAVVTRSY